jgi:hypothetical protein
MPVIPPPAFAYTPNESWLWNGFALNQPYWNISSFGGSRSGIPVLRGANYSVPYRAGQSWRPKYPDQRTITMTMWLSGAGSANHAYPAADARLAFNDNWQALRQAFWTRGAITGSLQGQLQRNWYLTTTGSPGLVTSTAMAEIAGSMDLTMSGRVGAGFSVDLLLSDPFFYSALVTAAVTTSGGTVTNSGDSVAGEGWSSAVNSFTITCTAATTVTNTTAGVGFTLSSGPSFPVTVDVLNLTVIDSGGANRAANLTHAGSRLWMGLLPGANTITNTGGTSTFRFNPSWL